MDNTADECQCTFSSSCTCADAQKFLDCISAVCQNSACNCKENDQYMAACGAMSATCPSIGLQCVADKATCSGAAVAETSGTSTNGGHPEGYVPIDHHEKEVKEKKAHGHHLFAVLMLMVFVMLTSFFAFTTSSDKVLATNTYAVIDSIVVTSIALTIFYIFDHIFEDLTEGYAHYRVTLHVVYAICVLFIAFFGSWSLRNDPIALQSFNAVIYWVCLLAKSGALTTAQRALPATYTDVLLITAGSLLFFLILMLITHQIKPEPGWYDAVETNLAGGAVAAGLCQLVGVFINGLDHHPQKHQNTDQANLTTLWVLSTCVLAVVASSPMSRMKAANKGYWRGRFLCFVDGLIGILPYFTVSCGLGAVICSHLDIEAGSMMANLVSSVTSVAVGFLMIFICTVVPYLRGQAEDVKALAGLIMGFGGYVAGYALATLLVGAIDEALSGRGLKGHELTIARTIIIVLFNAQLIPVYIKCLKPLIIARNA